MENVIDCLVKTCVIIAILGLISLFVKLVGFRIAAIISYTILTAMFSIFLNDKINIKIKK